MDKTFIFEEITKAMAEQYRAKNADYGDSFGETFQKFGIISALTRISDKFNRVVSLFKSGEQHVKDESAEDTLLDMANYCVMTVIELRARIGDENDSDVQSSDQAEKTHQNTEKAHCRASEGTLTRKERLMREVKRGFCPTCKNKRSVGKFHCVLLDSERKCNWSLTDEEQAVTKLQENG